MAGKEKRVSVAVRPPERHNAAFVVGSVVGGLAGAAVALWTAPRSGAELRQQLTGGESASVTRTITSRRDTRETAPTGTPLTGKVLSFVERAAAPIVGVKLGQTANGSGAVTGENDVSTAIRTDTATTEEVGESGRVAERITFGIYSGRTSASSGTTTDTLRTPEALGTEPAGGATDLSATVTPEPSPASTSIPEGTPGHVPTTDELVTPAEPVVDPAGTSRVPEGDKLFPDFDEGTKRS